MPPGNPPKRPTDTGEYARDTWERLVTVEQGLIHIGEMAAKTEERIDEKINETVAVQASIESDLKQKIASTKDSLERTIDSNNKILVKEMDQTNANLAETNVKLQRISDKVTFWMGSLAVLGPAAMVVAGALVTQAVRSTAQQSAEERAEIRDELKHLKDDLKKPAAKDGGR